MFQTIQPAEQNGDSPFRGRERDAVWSTSGIYSNLIFLGVWLIPFGFLIYIIINDWTISQELTQFGQWTQGIVTKREETRAEEQTIIQITYEYPVVGIGGATRIFQGTGDNSKYYVGEPIDIIYSTRHPAIHRIKDNFIYYNNLIDFMSREWPLLLMTGFGTLVDIYSLRKSIINLSLASALKRDGSIAPCIVMRKDYSKWWSNRYYAHYQYQINRQSYVLREEISFELADQLKTGIRLKVRYLPDHPEVAQLAD